MEEQPKSQPVSNQPISPPQVPVKQNNKPLMIIAILVFLLMAGGLVYLVYQNYQLQQRLDQLLEQQISPSPSPTAVFPSPEISTQSEIGNSEMKNATKVISSDGKYQLWLDGLNFTATQLWVSNVDGSQKQLLVTGISNTQNTKVGDYSLVNPVWSPDGTKIAYLRAVIDNIGQLDVTDRLDLYIVEKDGVNDHLVKAGISASRGQYGKTDLQWTQDGISYTDYSSSVNGVKTVIPPN